VVHVAVREKKPLGKEHFVAEAGADAFSRVKEYPVFAAQQPG
jgi:hypothetical protein